MNWPSRREYANAVINPAAYVKDPELAGGQTAVNPVRGTPLDWNGSFAVTYKIKGAGGRKDYAVKCFAGPVTGRQERYKDLAQYLKQHKLPGFVGFDYQPEGIKVGGRFYPILKMDWIEGNTLDRHIEDNLNNKKALLGAAANWADTALRLHRFTAAHNDLQHGNIIVQQNRQFKLVDYDGVFLPQYQGQQNPEGGHKNYQHPRKREQDYNKQIDNFPALVIYLSLMALAGRPELWRSFHNGDNLILTREDFLEPGRSECLKELKRHPDGYVKELSLYLEQQIRKEPAKVPGIDRMPGMAAPAQPAPTPAPPKPKPKPKAPPPPKSKNPPPKPKPKARQQPASPRMPSNDNGRAYRELLRKRQMEEELSLKKYHPIPRDLE